MHNQFFADLIEREISFAQCLQHENLLRKLKVYREDNDFFILQEHGSVLKNHILPHLHRFSELKAASIIKQVLEALNYLHERNIVHRAVKSQNVILGHPLHFYGEAKVEVKLGDEGLASMSSGTEAIKAIDLYTADMEIASPQLIKLIENHDELTEKQMEEQKLCMFAKSDDVWALGCLVYEIFTGRLPFIVPQAHSPDQIRELGVMITTQEPLFNETDSLLRDNENVRDFIASCLEKNENERATVSDLLKSPWMLDMQNRLEEKLEKEDAWHTELISYFEKISSIMTAFFKTQDIFYSLHERGDRTLVKAKFLSFYKDK